MIGYVFLIDLIVVSAVVSTWGIFERISLCYDDIFSRDSTAYEIFEWHF